MPKIKIKTHSGAKKRFSLTKTGKVKRAMTKKRHLLNGHGKTTKLKSSARHHLRRQDQRGRHQAHDPVQVR